MKSIAKKACLSAGMIALIALMLPTLASATELQLESEPGEPLLVAFEVSADSSHMEIADTLLYGDVECKAADQKLELIKNNGDVGLVGVGGSASQCAGRSQGVAIYDFTLAELEIVQPGTGTITVRFTSVVGGIECKWKGEGTFSYEAGTDTIELDNVPLETGEICGSDAELTGDFVLTDLWSGEPVLITEDSPEWAIQSPGESTSPLTDVSCVSSSECIAVGPFNARRWNGSEWLALPYPGAASDVSCTSSTSCVAVTSSGLGAWHWNGSAWSTITAATPSGASSGKLFDVSCRGSGCIAVGRYSANGETHTLAERYDGEAWSVLTTPSEEGGSNLLSAVSCAPASSCIAIGEIGGQPLALSLSWFGSESTTLPAPKHSAWPPTADISCVSNWECMAVGQGASEAERWNGSKWIGTPFADPEDGEGIPEQVRGVSCGWAECIAVGSYDIASTGELGPLVERWNGTEWEAQEAAIPAGKEWSELFGVSCSGSARCTAVGHTMGTEALIERYQ